MRKRLRPILPGMRGRVFADEGLPIVGAVGSGVIGLQRFLVAARFIAEDQLKGALEAGLADQPLPIEMPDLVAEMAEQRPVGLAKRDAPEFTLAAAGLAQFKGT